MHEEARARGLSLEQYLIIRRRSRSSYVRSAVIEMQARAGIDDYTKARLEAARLALTGFLRECRAIGCCGMHLGKAAFAEMGKLCDDLQIPDFRSVLYVEFVHPCVLDALEAQLAECEKSEDLKAEPENLLLDDVNPIAAEPRALQKPIRKAGRPRKFTDELPLAYKAEAAGKRNKEIAKILHKTDTPTDTQVNSVSKILNYHRRLEE